MMKQLRYFMTLLLLAVTSLSWAKEVTDVLTYDAIGVTKTTYTDWSNLKLQSDAVYAGKTAGGNTSIQMRSKDNNSGIVTTTSGGKVKSVTVEWNSNTAATRTLLIYGRNSAYTSPTELYGDAPGYHLASFVKSYGNQTYTIEGDYKYIGFRSDDAAMYIDKINIVWEVEENAKPMPTVTIDATEIALGGTATITTNGPEFILTTTNGEVATVSGNVVTGVGVGDATIIAEWIENDTYAAGDKTFAISVYDPNISGTKANPYTVSEAREAIDAGTGTTGVYATGIVSAITTPYNTQYGNITFNFVDNAGDDVFLQADRCTGSANVDASDVQIGDIVVVYGNLTKHNNTTYEFDSGCQLVSLTHAAVAIPTFSPEAGVFYEAQNVTISCETEGATIKYSTDKQTWTDYTAPIAVAETTTIYAKAVKGNTESAVASATFEIRDANTPGSDNNPYSVADAIGAIDAGTGLTGVYATGVVTNVKGFYSSKYITYTISDDESASNQLDVYNGLGIDGANFTSVDDVQVGDIVVVYGNLTKYGATYEFAANNHLVSLERKQNNEGKITVAQTEVDIEAAGGEGTIDVTMQNIEEAELQWFDAAGGSATYDWIEAALNADGNIEYIVEGNTGEERIAYLQVYGLDGNAEEVLSEVITFTQAAYVEPATANKYKLVTSTKDVTDGEYLIVYTSDENQSLAFDGSLEKLDAAGNTQLVTATDDVIEASSDIAFTITALEEGFYIQSASGLYIGQTSDANGLQANAQTAYTNTISIEDGVADIVSGGAYLRYNKTANQERFRYYKSTTYGNQQPIQLFKKVEDEAAPTVEVEIGATGYATLFYSEKSFILTSDIEATTYKYDEAEGLVVSRTFNQVIPAGQAVVLSGEPGTYEIEVSPYTFEDEKDLESMLYGFDEPSFCEKDGENLYYMLSTDASGEEVGFYWGAADGAAFNTEAHKAFLAIPVALFNGTAAKAFVLNGQTTSINSLEQNAEKKEIYDLQGRKMNAQQLPKGIYIVNGKKMVIK